MIYSLWKVGYTLSYKDDYVTETKEFLLMESTLQTALPQVTNFLRNNSIKGNVPAYVSIESMELISNGLEVIRTEYI